MKLAYLLNSYPMTSTTFIRREIGAIERMLLDGHVMQARRPCGILFQSRTHAEEVEPQAEPDLEDGEGCASAPARGQVVACEEHVTCLCRAAVGGMVDIVERFGARHAGGIER